jgi:hypothetical protein
MPLGSRLLMVCVPQSCSRLDTRERHKKPPAEAGGKVHANPRHRAAVRLAGLRPLGINPALRAWRSHKKPRVETREHAAREPAASCRGSPGGPPPAWNQPGPPGLALPQEAPGGNPGACCTRTRGVVPRFAWRACARLESTRPSGPGAPTRSPGWKPGDTGSHAFPGAMRCGFASGNHVQSCGMDGGLVVVPGVPGLPPGASWTGDGTDPLFTGRYNTIRSWIPAAATLC